MNKTQMNIKEFIKTSLDQLNFNDLTEVQAEVIPLALKGENLIVQSQTGSGKTHSFLIPIFEKVDPQINEVQAVITAPSRELAEQLFQVAIQIGQNSPEKIRIVKYFGGTDKQKQLEKLSVDNQPHIVIGTPGRIFDLMNEHALFVQTTKIFVVDEADMTFDLGFLTIVDEIASRMPEDLQMMVFSATIPQQVEVFLRKYMVGPKRIEIKNKEVISSTVKNYIINTKGKDPKELTYKLLTMGHPFLALVFANTKQYADEVTNFLREKGLKVAKIHGDIESRERNRVMKQIRNLEFQYVVATDLAARGIDIPGTSLIINLEVPTDLEYFIHRVGRTGRNGQSGEAFTFVTPDDDQMISKLEDKGISFIPVELSNNEIKETHSRDRRKLRKNIGQTNENDTEIVRMIHQTKKKKVKPGYKRKLKQDIQSYKKKLNRKK